MRVTPMPVQLPDARAWRSQLALAALLLTTIALSFGIVLQPWLLIGMVAGAIVLSVADGAEQQQCGTDERHDKIPGQGFYSSG